MNSLGQLHSVLHALQVHTVKLPDLFNLQDSVIQDIIVHLVKAPPDQMLTSVLLVIGV